MESTGVCSQKFDIKINRNQSQSFDINFRSPFCLRSPHFWEDALSLQDPWALNLHTAGGFVSRLSEHKMLPPVSALSCSPIPFIPPCTCQPTIHLSHHGRSSPSRIECRKSELFHPFWTNIVVIRLFEAKCFIVRRFLKSFSRIHHLLTYLFRFIPLLCITFFLPLITFYPLS